VSVEGGINSNIQETHLFAYGGLLHLGTFSQVLKEIVEDKDVGGAQTGSGGVGKARRILAAGGFSIR
jgi:hypothetical protein